MSYDTIPPVGSTRPDYLDGVGPDHPTPRPSDNPLVKGLVVLVMLAVATTVLVATRDGDEPTTVAASSLESEPLAPAQAAPVEEDPAEGDGADDPAGDETRPWLAPQSMQLSNGGVAERLRQLALADTTTTTEPTTTTSAPPTTAATTESTTSTTAATTVAEDSTTSAVDTTAAGDTTAPTETTAPGSTDTSAPSTTVAAETTTTAAPTTAAPATTAGESGWVDAGHGVLVPPVLLAIRYCESRDNYQAANPSSSARGAYQFLTGSWAAYGHADRYGVSQAHLATNVQQDEAALLTWQRDGTRPWNASKSCWSSRI